MAAVSRVMLQEEAPPIPVPAAGWLKIVTVRHNDYTGRKMVHPDFRNHHDS
jgi:hypothetical protein